MFGVRVTPSQHGALEHSKRGTLCSFNTCINVGGLGGECGLLKCGAQIKSSPCPEKSITGNCELEGMRLSGHLILSRDEKLSNHLQVLSENTRQPPVLHPLLSYHLPTHLPNLSDLPAMCSHPSLTSFSDYLCPECLLHFSV